METIIGLLMILLPVVLKLIGKRLEQAGKTQPTVTSEEQEPIEDWEQTIGQYVEQQTVAQPESPAPSAPEPLVPEPMVKDSVEAHVTAKPKMQKQKKKTVKKAPILLEEEKKQREKIDVKKLIVYSEIMTPKYTE